MMKPSSPITSISTQRQNTRPSLHSDTYSSLATSGMSTAAPAELSTPSEIASMYTRQFALSKTSAVSGHSSSSQVYQAHLSSSAPTAGQTYAHGLSVLQCARTRAPADPHVYRDWLIFEERLKQSYRRLQRKKRGYLVQILAFAILAVYFAWFGFLGTRSYRLTCKLLSAGSVYCIYFIVTNRRFLQSIKYPAQCNRILHQFRMRFETGPLQIPPAFLEAVTSEADTASTITTGQSKNSNSTLGSKARVSSLGKPPSFLTESQLSFFPTVPRQLREGYMDFKVTYYRKRDAAKKRMQERQKRDRQRKNSVSAGGGSNATTPRSSERRAKNRSINRTPTQRPATQDNGNNSSVGDYLASPSRAAAIGGRIPSDNSSSRMSSNGNYSPGLSSFLSGMDSSITDDGSTTSSSMVAHTATSSPLGGANVLNTAAAANRRAGSNLVYSSSGNLDIAADVGSDSDDAHSNNAEASLPHRRGR